MNAITKEFDSKKRNCEGMLKKGDLDKIIEEQRNIFGLPGDWIVNPATIRSRIRSGRKRCVHHRGVSPPLAEMEGLLSSVIVYLADANMPLTVSESMAFANSLLKGTELQKKYVRWTKCRTNNLDFDGELGVGWWRGFVKRYAHILEVKKGRLFSCQTGFDFVNIR